MIYFNDAVSWIPPKFRKLVLVKKHTGQAYDELYVPAVLDAADGLASLF